MAAKRTIDRERAAALYQSGLGSSEIARIMGHAQSSLLRAIKTLIVTRDGPTAHSLAWRGNKGRRKDGYIRVRTGRNERRLEHRVIAEQVLGRPLRSREVVHHINCDPSDNRRENLLICSHKYHAELHARMRAHPYWSQFENRR